MKCRTAFAAFVLAVALIGGPAAGTAQTQGRLYVIESTVSAIKVGKEYSLTDTITIPPGGTIRAVMPSGSTKTISGPYTGPVADLAKGQRITERVSTWIREFFEKGGATERTPGATRGLRADDPDAFSWTAVPASMNSTVCVTRSGQLQLVREPSTAAARVVVVDIERSKKGEARWARGGTRTAWPSSVDPRDGATYTLLVPDQPPRELKLHVLDRIPDEDDVLGALAARGCRHQFDALMRERIKG